MNYEVVPVIVMICYVFGEIYKKIFKNKNQLIPVILTALGGLIGLLICLTSSEMVGTKNIWEAIMIGMISGASSTGANQIVKQIFKKGGEQ